MTYIHRGCRQKESGYCYVHHKCRCNTCRKANTARCYRAKAKRDPSTLPKNKHGKVSTYLNWNCRCKLCKSANAKLSAVVRARRTPQQTKQRNETERKRYGRLRISEGKTYSPRV